MRATGVALSGLVALAMTTGAALGATSDQKATYIRNWSVACQTRGAQGMQLSRAELAAIDALAFAGLEGRFLGVQALGGATRDLARVRAEVCTCAAGKLSNRRNLNTAPDNDLLWSALESCSNATRVLR